jgi:hypothetical protein
MLLTIGIILVATIALAATEVWLFWLAGQRVDRRRGYRRDRPRPRRNRAVTTAAGRRGGALASTGARYGSHRATGALEREGWEALATGNGDAH